jgi:hypothetical protein
MPNLNHKILDVLNFIAQKCISKKEILKTEWNYGKPCLQEFIGRFANVFILQNTFKQSTFSPIRNDFLTGLTNCLCLDTSKNV